MNIESACTQLATAANQIGSRIDWVQGGGGNISLKFETDQMLVKSSGFKLSEVTRNDGLTLIDFYNLKNILFAALKSELNSTKNIIYDEEFYQSKVKENTLQNSLLIQRRASIETGFHAILGNVVIHTHSVYANIFNCSVNGFEKLKELFPKAIFIDYYNPGLELTLEIFEKTQHLDLGKSIVIFLKNHGLIVSSPTLEQAIRIHHETNLLLEQEIAINFNDFQNSFVPNRTILDFPEILHPSNRNEIQVLFPDQAIYLSKNKINCLNDQAKAAAEFDKNNFETNLALDFILMGIQKIKLGFSFVNSAKIEVVKNMESEQYRKNLKL